MRRLSRILLSLVVIAGAGYTTSNAISYSASTVYVGGKAVGTGKGAATLRHTSGTVISVSGQTKDYKPGRESVYWNAQVYDTSGMCLSSNYTSCSQDFYFERHIRGRNFNSGSWQSSTNSARIDPTAKAARVGFQVCVDKRFQVDPCSTPNFTSQVIKYVQ